MKDERAPDPTQADELDREAILARRRRFVAAALSRPALTGCSSAISSSDAGPWTCLTADLGEVSSMPRLGVPLDAGSPMPCLDTAFTDAGADGNADE